MARLKNPSKPAKPAPPKDEAEFLAGYDATVFERPSVAVDVVLISIPLQGLPGVVVDQRVVTLVLRRTEHPHRGRFALPGGFVNMKESLEAAARRVLKTKAGLERVFLEQLYTFGDPDRDPRTRVISVAYYALVDAARFDDCTRAHPEAQVARVVVPWEGETGGPVSIEDAAGAPLELAFDHADVLGTAMKRLRGKLDYSPIGFQLLPETFTLLDLMTVHETLLGRPLNKDSFRRRMLASGLLEATGEKQQDVGHRPAELYRFVKRSAV